MKVLIACEYSGRVRRAFAEKGHEVYSCDLLPSEDNSPNHIIGDVFHVLHSRFSMGVDLFIGHPSCQYLANSGVRWLYNSDGSINTDRWQKMEAAAKFFVSFLNQNAGKICVENPIIHKHAKKLIGAEQTQTIQPWMFGHKEVKATCLWLNGLKPLIETNNVKDEMLKLPYGERAKVHFASPGPERWKERSRTLEGIAKAMADQWG